MGDGEIADKILDEIQKLSLSVALINQKLGDVDEHDRALKGSNGNTGLIAKVDKIAADMEGVKKHMDILDKKGCFTDAVKPTAQSDQVQWSNIRDKIGLPLLVTAIAFLVFTLGPKLMALIK